MHQKKASIVSSMSVWNSSLSISILWLWQSVSVARLSAPDVIMILKGDGKDTDKDQSIRPWHIRRQSRSKCEIGRLFLSVTQYQWPLAYGQLVVCRYQGSSRYRCCVEVIYSHGATEVSNEEPSVSRNNTRNIVLRHLVNLPTLAPL